MHKIFYNFDPLSLPSSHPFYLRLSLTLPPFLTHSLSLYIYMSLPVYNQIYFLKGTLPWQGLKAKNASKKYLLILSKKQSVSIAQLCQGCPSQFAEFLVRLNKSLSKGQKIYSYPVLYFALLIFALILRDLMISDHFIM